MLYQVGGLIEKVERKSRRVHTIPFSRSPITIIQAEIGTCLYRTRRHLLSPSHKHYSSRNRHLSIPDPPTSDQSMPHLSTSNLSRSDLPTSGLPTSDMFTPDVPAMDQSMAGLTISDPCVHTKPVHIGPAHIGPVHIGPVDIVPVGYRTCRR